MKTLYVNRPLLNGEKLVNWANENGFYKIESPEKMHCTIVYSKAKVDWNKFAPDNNEFIRVYPSTNRKILHLGEAIVLNFHSQYFQNRWKYFLDNGASYDFDKFIPHVTFSYGIGHSTNPYEGILEFGPEEWKEVDD